MRRRFLLLLLFFAGCTKLYEFKAVPDGPINHQLIVLAQNGNKVQARGFAGAVPPNTTIDFTLGAEQRRLQPKSDGSFALEIPLNDSSVHEGHFSFSIGKKTYSQVYSIKDLDHALATLAKPALVIKEQIDDFLIEGDKALLLSSAAAELSQMKLKDSWVLENNEALHRALNPDGKQALLPGAFAVFEDHALVTLSATHELLLVDLKDGRHISKTRLYDEQGSLYLFTLNPALVVKNPLSADDSSPPSTTISHSFAHSPDQALALSSQRFIVSFSNYYQYNDQNAGTDAVLGPAIVAMLDINAQGLVTKSIITLPFKNPVFINKSKSDELWVTCAGVYYNVGSELKSTLAGLVKLETKNDQLRIKHQIALHDFVPGRPAFIEDTIILPEAFGKRVAVFKENSTVAMNDLKVAFYGDFRFINATHWHSDVVFLGEAGGSLIAFSLSEGFFPFPFIKPIPLDSEQSSKVAFMPAKIIFRHQERGHGFDQKFSPGFSALVLSQLQSRIIPLDLLGVFGP